VVTLLSFIKDFLKKYNTNACECRFMQKIICDNCNSKNSSVIQFMSNTEKLIKDHQLWNNEEEDIRIAIIQIQRSIMGTLYEHTFVTSNDDIELKKEFTSSIPLDLDKFQVPQKYHSEAPWLLAQLELQKINSYKSPYDKYLCISRCWEIISNCISLLDDPGADDCYPIMEFVIYSANIDNITANVQYIQFYGMLDDIEQCRLKAFRDVLKTLLRTLSTSPKKKLIWYWPQQELEDKQLFRRSRINF